MQKVSENTGLDSSGEVSEDNKKGVVETYSGPIRRFMETSGSISGVLVEEGPKLPYQEYLDERAEINKLFRQ